MATPARTMPLLVTGLAVLAALAVAVWLAFFAAPPKTVEDVAVLPVPQEPPPAPMLKPKTTP